MAAFSRLIESSMPFTCYEIAHPWNTSCSASWVTLYGSTFKKSFKVYGALYLIAQLLGRRISAEAFLDTLSSTVRSASFLSYNVFYFMFFICALRRLFGRLYLQNSTFVAGLLSGFLSVLVERRGRRRLLSVYMLNQCSEIVFNMLESRGMVQRIPRGEVYMFAISLSVFLYYMSLNRGLRDPVSSALRYLMGREEFAQSAPRTEPEHSRATSRTAVCPHPGGCWSNVVKGFAFPFAVGYGVRVLFYLAARRSPLSAALWRSLTNPSHLGQGLFLGGATSIFRACKCTLRHVDRGERPWHSLVGGLLGGLCMVACPNSGLSLYLTWKLVEVLYCRAAHGGLAPTVPLGAELLFGLSCGVMMFCAVVEPHNMRPSYAKFINDVTGDKLRQVNRHPLEILGYHCSSVYPDYFPQLDPKHVSRSFVERVLVWA